LQVFEPEAERFASFKKKKKKAESFARVWLCATFGEFRAVASVAVGDLTDHFHLGSVALLHQSRSLLSLSLSLFKHRCTHSIYKPAAWALGMNNSSKRCHLYWSKINC